MSEIGGENDPVEMTGLYQIIQAIRIPAIRRRNGNGFAPRKINKIDVVLLRRIQHTRHKLRAPGAGQLRAKHGDGSSLV